MEVNRYQNGLVTNILQKWFGYQILHSSIEKKNKRHNFHFSPSTSQEGSIILVLYTDVAWTVHLVVSGCPIMILYRTWCIVMYQRLIIGQPQFPVLCWVFRPSPTQAQLTHPLHLPACVEATNVFTVPPSLRESVWLWVWCVTAFAWMSAVDDFSCEVCGVRSLFTLS